MSRIHGDDGVVGAVDDVVEGAGEHAGIEAGPAKHHLLRESNALDRDEFLGVDGFIAGDVVGLEFVDFIDVFKAHDGEDERKLWCTGIANAALIRELTGMKSGPPEFFRYSLEIKGYFLEMNRDCRPSGSAAGNEHLRFDLFFGRPASPRSLLRCSEEFCGSAGLFRRSRPAHNRANGFYPVGT